MAKSFLGNFWFTLRADKMLINGGLDNTLQEGLAWERKNVPVAALIWKNGYASSLRKALQCIWMGSFDDRHLPNQLSQARI